MPNQTLLVPVAPLPAHPKVRIRAVPSGSTLTLPLGPVGGRLAGWTRNWQEVARPGRKTVLVDTAPGLRTAAYTLNVAHPAGSDITDVLTGLRAYAESPGGYYWILGLGGGEESFEAGPWRITRCDVDIRRREHGTNRPLFAVVDLELTQAETPNLRIARSGRVTR